VEENSYYISSSGAEKEKKNMPETLRARVSYADKGDVMTESVLTAV
jgi:hypothetical protein